jgi:hypothetical protein
VFGFAACKAIGIERAAEEHLIGEGVAIHDLEDARHRCRDRTDSRCSIRRDPVAAEQSEVVPDQQIGAGQHVGVHAGPVAIVLIGAAKGSKMGCAPIIPAAEAPWLVLRSVW